MAIRQTRRYSLSGTMTTTPRTWHTCALLIALVVSAGGMSGNGCTIGFPGPSMPSGTTGSGTLAEGGPVLLPDDHILGDPDAELIVVQYSSFGCNLCGRFARVDLPIIQEQYIDTGLIRFVFRHYATDTDAIRAARASECAADQDAFWEFHDALFDDNSDLSEERLVQIAEDIGLDVSEFEDCLAGPSKETRVTRDENSAEALGVSQNITYFIGSRRLDGFLRAEDLSQAIDRALAE